MLTIAEQLMELQVTWTDSLREAVRMTFLDTIGAMIMGAQEAEVQRLMDVLSAADEGHCFQVVGDARKFSLTDAAFMMGTSSVAVELDEGNQWSKGHPAVHVLPMLLLHSQQEKAYTGGRFMEDMVKGYEACTHFGKITQLKPDLHAHGTWGVLGSAASLGIANEVDVFGLSKLLNTAATFATPTKWTAALEGAGVRNVYMAESLVGGLRAWQLTQADIAAPSNNAAFIYGELLGTGFNLETPLGEDSFAIENNYFKFHAFCRYVHVPIEAFQLLIKEHGIHIDAIETITVATYARAATLKEKKPGNSLSSKFSIPFALASSYYDGRSDHSIFKEKLYEQEQIRELASKVTVLHDPVLDENYPNVMPARVTITTKTKEIFSRELDYALGGPDEKSNYAMIREKFLHNTAGILTTKGQEEVLAFLDELKTQPSVQEIFSIINNQIDRRVHV